MSNQRTIEMVEVYRILLENPMLEFNIKYVRSTTRGSKPKGSIKSVRLGMTPNARRMAEGKQIKTNSISKRKYLHKNKWTLSLYNWSKDRPETPLYSHVIEFEGQIIKH